MASSFRTRFSNPFQRFSPRERSGSCGYSMNKDCLRIDKRCNLRVFMRTRPNSTLEFTTARANSNTALRIHNWPQLDLAHHMRIDRSMSMADDVTL